MKKHKNYHVTVPFIDILNGTIGVRTYRIVESQRVFEGEVSKPLIRTEREKVLCERLVSSGMMEETLIEDWLQSTWQELP